MASASLAKRILLDLPLFRRPETLVLDFLVAVSRVGVGDVIWFGDRGRRHRHDDEAAKFRRGIKLPGHFEVTCQFFLGGGGQRARARGGKHDVIDAPGFHLKAENGLQQSLRQLDAVGQRIDDLTAQTDTALLPHIGLFGKSFVAQKRVEPLPIEPAAHPLEIVVVHDRLFDLLVADRKP